MNDVAFRTAIGASILLLALVVRAASVNRLVRRKLRLSFFLALVYTVVAIALGRFALTPDMAARVLSVIQLCMALAIINLIVVIAINPLRADRVPERFPNIVQDTIIIGLFLMVATVVMQEKFLTTSAVGAVVIGFALQDTLGNMFSGLAIQVEKPFRVGHWITVGPFEGMVSEVTWRATKIRTKAGNLVVLPNAFISKEAITNFSEPTAPTRLEVEVGVSYSVPPNQVKAALAEALRNAPAGLGDSGAGYPRQGLRRLRRRLPRPLLDRRLREGLRGARRGAFCDLLRAAAPRVRNPVPDADRDSEA